MTTIEDVTRWFIENLPNVNPARNGITKTSFAASVGQPFYYTNKEVKSIMKGKGRDYRLMASFPYNIITKNVLDSIKLTKRRNDLLIAEHDDPKIREAKRILLSTIYPAQINWFFPERIPAFDKQFGGYLVPVDWRLIGVVRYLWSKGLGARGWDDFDGTASITTSANTYYTQEELDNMSEESYQNLMKMTDQKVKEVVKEIDGLEADLYGIEFKIKDLPKIYRQIVQPIPKKRDAIRGGLITHYKPALRDAF